MLRTERRRYAFGLQQAANDVRFPRAEEGRDRHESAHSGYRSALTNVRDFPVPTWYRGAKIGLRHQSIRWGKSNEHRLRGRGTRPHAGNFMVHDRLDELSGEQVGKCHVAAASRRQPKELSLLPSLLHQQQLCPRRSLNRLLDLSDGIGARPRERQHDPRLRSPQDPSRGRPSIQSQLSVGVKVQARSPPRCARPSTRLGVAVVVPELARKQPLAVPAPVNPRVSRCPHPCVDECRGPHIDRECVRPAASD
jgi:hypothetical protein